MELHAFERMAQSIDTTLMHAHAEQEDCGLLPQPKTPFPADTPVGMAYVPFQLWGDVYEAEEGIARGTMFPALDKPFLAAEGGCCE